MKKITIALLAFFTLSACGRFKNKEIDGTKDIRIVSLSKHLTEFVFSLGKGSDLVGVDWSSTYPDSAKKITPVGYHRALNPEGIISLTPDLVIHSNDIGPATILPQIETAGLHTKAFGNANTIDSTKMLLCEMGDFFGVRSKADSLCLAMDASLQVASNTLRHLIIKDTPTVMIIHFGRANNVYFVMSGRKGVSDKLIEMAGAKVAHYDAKGAKQISPEAIATANPDIIIATDYGYDQMGSMEKFIAGVPGVQLTNAGKNRRIVRFEEHDLTYFGPRSGDNIIQLMNLFYPNKITGAKK
jgi:iron complex transport system substrate-binding protein